MILENEEIKKTEEKKEDIVAEAEVDVEYTTRTDYISCAFYSISAVEGLDVGLMTKEDAKRIKRILRKSLRIIDDCINEMHDELFEDDEEN